MCVFFVFFTRQQKDSDASDSFENVFAGMAAVWRQNLIFAKLQVQGISTGKDLLLLMMMIIMIIYRL